LGIKKLILENPFTSIDNLFPFSWFIKTKWDNLEVVGSDDLPPTLILTSENDELVSPEMSKQVILSGANHGDAGAHPDYLPAIEEFLRE
jgi:acetyl esterase/lipase